MWSGQSETTVTHVGTSFAVFCNDYICSPCVNPGLRGQHSFIIVKHHHTGKGKPHGPFKLTVQCSDNSKKQKENKLVVSKFLRLHSTVVIQKLLRSIKVLP